MDEKCGNCQNYIQHYGLNKKGLYRVYCGHCTCHSVKKKRPDAKACAHYIYGTADTERFATKEYLSKELLKYLLSLELLPQIKDEGTDG